MDAGTSGCPVFLSDIVKCHISQTQTELSRDGKGGKARKKPARWVKIERTYKHTRSSIAREHNNQNTS